MVSFVIDTTGHPLELLIVQSSGSRLIDTNILESIESTRYEPSTVDGFPKKVTIKSAYYRRSGDREGAWAHACA